MALAWREAIRWRSNTMGELICRTSKGVFLKTGTIELDWYTSGEAEVVDQRAKWSSHEVYHVLGIPRVVK